MHLCEDIYLSATSNFTVYLIWKWNHEPETDTEGTHCNAGPTAASSSWRVPTRLGIRAAQTREQKFCFPSDHPLMTGEWINREEWVRLLKDSNALCTFVSVPFQKPAHLYILDWRVTEISILLQFSVPSFNAEQGPADLLFSWRIHALCYPAKKDLSSFTEQTAEALRTMNQNAEQQQGYEQGGSRPLLEGDWKLWNKLPGKEAGWRQQKHWRSWWSRQQKNQRKIFSTT